MILNPLVVRIIDTVTGESWVYVFHVGPVSIGCGLDASLPIVRPFVTPQHGSFQFDDRSVRYQDHDPENCTLVDGAPARGREKAVTDWTQIEIGNVRITTSRRLPDNPVPDPALSPFGRLAGGRAVPPRPQDAAVPQRQELPGTPSPAASRPAARPTDLRARPSRRPAPSPAVERRPRRRVRARFSVLAWLSAIAVGLAVVGVAGLVLQFSGVRWMPSVLVSRIPPWLADWSSEVLGHRDPPEGGHRDPVTPVERPEPPRRAARPNAHPPQRSRDHAPAGQARERPTGP